MLMKLGNSFGDLAAGWILASGIQNVSDDPKLGGGFNGWLDMDTKSHPFIYSEITGYGMSTLVYLGKLREEKTFFDNAARAANWIIRNAITREGAILTKYYYGTNGFGNSTVYAFDTGMVLFGLCNTAKHSKNPEIIAACKKVADFLVDRMQKKGGEMHPMWDAKTNEFGDDGKQWSTVSGSYHAKMSMGLIATSEITGNDKYAAAAEKTCNSSLKFQKDDGRFVTHGDDTHLHPHCYSAEGLLSAGLKMGREDFIDASFKATEWAMNAQKSNGGIPHIYKNGAFSDYERADILAQTLRMASIFASMKKSGIDGAKLDALKRRLAEFQVKDGPQAGGIRFGFDFDGTFKNHVNSWCSMFALQAFYMNNQLEIGQKIDLDIIV